MNFFELPNTSTTVSDFVVIRGEIINKVDGAIIGYVDDIKPRSDKRMNMILSLLNRAYSRGVRDYREDNRSKT